MKVFPCTTTTHPCYLSDVKSMASNPESRKCLPPPSHVGSSPVFRLEFDGASKGNPGKAGAGAILKQPDGSVICELTKGIGVATCNFAEYEALIIGLQAALYEGIAQIEAQGDSNLVCKQVMGQWKLKSENLAESFAEVMKLKSKFQYFSIKHVYRESNSAADALANSATLLPENKLVKHYGMIPSWKRKVEEDGGKILNDFCSSKDAKLTFYQLAFHGACKGNPGKAGAGVVVSCSDGSMHLHIRKGLGVCTRNCAHYQALIIGLQAAVDHNVSHIMIQGDALLVYKQMLQKMNVKDENLRTLWKEANALLTRFTQHNFSHVEKSENSEACLLAEAAALLPEDSIRTSNVCNGPSTYSSQSDANIQALTQKVYSNRTRTPMLLKKHYNNSTRTAQFQGVCRSMLHLTCVQEVCQSTRAVFPQSTNSCFSFQHLRHCARSKSLPHFFSGSFLHIVQVASIGISAAIWR